jgi:peptidoglycan hydrolase CwlO-like protein
LRTPHLPRGFGGAALVTAALLLGAVAGPPAGADTASDLAAAKAQLTRLVDRISAAQDAVNGLQVEANRIAQQIDAVRSRIARVQGRIADANADMAQAQEELSATQERLDSRARAAYETGPALMLAVLLGAQSMSDMADRLAVLNAATGSDRSLIEKIEALQARLESRKAALTSLRTDLRAEQADLGRKEKSLQSKLTAAQALMDQLETDRAEANSLVTRLEEKRAAEIAAEKARLAAQQSASHGGSSFSGVFEVCPVDQPRAYWDDFGDPRYSGGYHPHAGNDIVAPTGTPIRATFSGTAADASNPLGGLSVKVYGSLGYTYNAHLSRRGQLGAVSAGDIIGYVGTGGDAKGGIPHDHFEWHPNSIPSSLWVSPLGYSIIGSAVDPYPYLNSVC